MDVIPLEEIHPVNSNESKQTQHVGWKFWIYVQWGK